MRTFLQLLRIAFWMLPLQRALTVIGAVVLVAGQFFQPRWNTPGLTLPITFFGIELMMAVPLLGGGVLLRMLSASRALLLRPHARGRLLGGVIGIVLLVTTAWIVCYALAFWSLPVKYRPDAEAIALMFAMTLSFGTLCSVTLFIASRSPLWTLLILLIWQAPGLMLHLLGAEQAERLAGEPVSLAMSAAVWIGFSIWYLRARRIHASGWSRREGTVEDPRAARVTVPVTREAAMTRWLLGGTTPLRIGMSCLLAALTVLVMQWIFAGDSGPGPLHAIMFGTLSLIAAAGGAVSRAMAAHARSLWLPSGKTRLALHAWAERQMLLVVAAIFAAVAIACLIVWWLVPGRPALPLAYVLAAVLAPGLAAAWLGLMQQHRSSLFDALAAVAVFAGWFHGLVRPLYGGAVAARWGVLVALLALAVLLREVAYVRWRSADWRRVQRV